MKTKVSIKGYEITKARYIKGLAMTDLAKICGLTVKTISDTENGRSIPNPKTILKICRALNLELTNIVA